MHTRTEGWTEGILLSQAYRSVGDKNTNAGGSNGYDREKSNESRVTKTTDILPPILRVMLC